MICLHCCDLNFFKNYLKLILVRWNCLGTKLASGSQDKSVAIYSLDRDRFTKEKTFYGHNGTVDQLTWHSTNPDLLATASGDRTVRLWDTRSYKPITTIATKGENINITWSQDGQTIAVGNKEDLITFIDAKTYKIRAEEKFNFEINEIMWNKSSDQVYLTSGQGCVHILSYPNLEIQHVLKAHPATCICIDFDNSGKYCAIGSADALTSIWDVEELACLRVNSRLDWPVRSVSFSHDSKLIASASEDHFIDIADLETGEQVAEIKLESATFSISFHPKQYLLAYACDDKKDQDQRDAGNFRVYGFFEG